MAVAGSRVITAQRGTEPSIRIVAPPTRRLRPLHSSSSCSSQPSSRKSIRNRFESSGAPVSRSRRASEARLRIVTGISRNVPGSVVRTRLTGCPAMRASPSFHGPFDDPPLHDPSAFVESHLGSFGERASVDRVAIGEGDREPFELGVVLGADAGRPRGGRAAQPLAVAVDQAEAAVLGNAPRAKDDFLWMEKREPLNRRDGDFCNSPTCRHPKKPTPVLIPTPEAPRAPRRRRPRCPSSFPLTPRE